jgi:hypothetical protein
MSFFDRYSQLCQSRVCAPLVPSTLPPPSVALPVYMIVTSPLPAYAPPGGFGRPIGMSWSPGSDAGCSHETEYLHAHWRHACVVDNKHMQAHQHPHTHRTHRIAHPGCGCMSIYHSFE